MDRSSTWFAIKGGGAHPNARYAVFHCADNLDGEPAKGGEQSPGQYYESVDLVDAFHPQTLIAYDLNGKPLDVGNGAPLRLRVERQLGYKQAKYLQRIEITDSFAISPAASVAIGKTAATNGTRAYRRCLPKP